MTKKSLQQLLEKMFKTKKNILALNLPMENQITLQSEVKNPRGVLQSMMNIANCKN